MFTIEETKNQAIEFVETDGGRSEYFEAPYVGDCVVRAIALASGKDYKEVYDELHRRNKEFAENKRCKVAKQIKKKGPTPRNGNYKKVYHQYILDLGFEWVSTMEIGSGMQVHVKEEELPEGVLILRLSRHLACVKEKTLYDTYDCSRSGNRGVYGYYIKK